MVPSREDRFLAAGTYVRLDAFVNDDDTVTSEYGVVVHCWLNEEIGMHDCYVAFFGEQGFPEGEPDESPYVLRYGSISLVVLSGKQAN
ncbi:MAG: hypothetical protein EOP59_10005 [Sphingomonadales bacterium]|nr:MAG: hypothetical protein EOP59_10005 [Sphingomonadales bacterium]